MQQAGITFSNAWGSPLYLAHLYNAVKQEGLLKRTWPDMELIISFHTKERIFVGDKPTNVEEYMKRFALTMGLSAQAFAPKGPRSLLEDTTPVSELYRAKLCGKPTRQTSSPCQISIRSLLPVLAVPVVELPSTDTGPSFSGYSAEIPSSVCSSRKDKGKVKRKFVLSSLKKAQRKRHQRVLRRRLNRKLGSK